MVSGTAWYSYVRGDIVAIIETLGRCGGGGGETKTVELPKSDPNQSHAQIQPECGAISTKEGQT